MTIPKEIQTDEELGRGIFSSKDANRARRSGVPYPVFLEKQGRRDISVDRLSLAPRGQAIAIAEDVGKIRNRTFYGWALAIAKDADGNGREVVASPLANNPWHADIRLPQLAAEDREEQIRHAKELADISRWRDR